jgi:hypothetical protein
MGINFKKTIITTILLGFLCPNIAFAQDTFSGHIQKDEQNQQELDKELFTGEIETIDKKDIITFRGF